MELSDLAFAVIKKSQSERETERDRDREFQYVVYNMQMKPFFRPDSFSSTYQT